MEKNPRVSNIPIKLSGCKLIVGGDDHIIRTTLRQIRRYFNWSDTFRGSLFAYSLREAGFGKNREDDYPRGTRLLLRFRLGSYHRIWKGIYVTYAHYCHLIQCIDFDIVQTNISVCLIDNCLFVAKALLFDIEQNNEKNLLIF